MDDRFVKLIEPAADFFFLFYSWFEVRTVKRHELVVDSCSKLVRFSQWFKRKKKKKIGPLARNCRWTLLTQLTDRF